MLADEARGLTLRDAVERCGESPLRNCVLGTMAFASGQLTEAEMRFSDALNQARRDPEAQPLAALAANRLAGTYTLLGAGKKVMALGRWALDTGVSRRGKQPDPDPHRHRGVAGGWPTPGPHRTGPPGIRSSSRGAGPR